VEAFFSNHPTEQTLGKAGCSQQESQKIQWGGERTAQNEGNRTLHAKIGYLFGIVIGKEKKGKNGGAVTHYKEGRQDDGTDESDGVTKERGGKNWEISQHATHPSPRRRINTKKGKKSRGLRGLPRC